MLNSFKSEELSYKSVEFQDIYAWIKTKITGRIEVLVSRRGWRSRFISARLMLRVSTNQYGTHSMRRSKASLIYKVTGNSRAAQILLGHINIESTVRYLGVDVGNALTLSERAEI